MGSGKPKEFEKEAKTQKAEQVKQAEKGKPTEQKRKIVPAGIHGIIRISEVDVDGTKKLYQALLRVKGIGQTLAAAIPKAAGIDANALAGSLSDQQLEHIEAVINDPLKFGIPVHLVNRRSDPVTGTNKQLVSSELSITNKSDIDMMKKMRCYKGIRHELGLPVRGQRTRSSFRTGMTAGVTRAKAVAAAAPPKGAPAAPGAKPAAATPAAPGAKPAGPAKAAPAPAKKEEKK